MGSILEPDARILFKEGSFNKQAISSLCPPYVRWVYPSNGEVLLQTSLRMQQAAGVNCGLSGFAKTFPIAKTAR